MSNTSPSYGGGRSGRFLASLEKIGNRFPHPFVLFIGIFVVLCIVSAIFASLGSSVQVPGSKEILAIKSILTLEGFLYMLDNVIKNFINFPGLGNIFFMVMTVTVAQGSGVLETAVRALMSKVPAKLVPYAVAFVAAQGHIFSDASYFVIAPLGAFAFKAAGRNPVAGLIGAYAVLQGGYAGGMVLGTLDATYVAITERVAQLVPVHGDYIVHIAMNIFYTATVGILFPIVGGWIIANVLEPRLPAFKLGKGESKEGEVGFDLTPEQRRGLLWSGIAFMIFVGATLVAWLLPEGILRGQGGTLVPSPLLSNMVLIIGTAFIILGVTYGKVAKTFNKDTNVNSLMKKGLQNISSATVIIFIIAQVLAVLTWTNLGTLFAVNLAQLAESAGLTGFGALLLLVLVSAILNMIITSGGSLWSLVGPVMVPSMMLLGLHPAVIQAAFRIGDSTTTLITPLSIWMYVLLNMAKEYEPDLELGTLISRLAIFLVPFFAVWIGALALFYFLGLPLGPGTGIFLPK